MVVVVLPVSRASRRRGRAATWWRSNRGCSRRRYRYSLAFLLLLLLALFPFLFLPFRSQSVSRSLSLHRVPCPLFAVDHEAASQYPFLQRPANPCSCLCPYHSVGPCRPFHQQKRETSPRETLPGSSSPLIDHPQSNLKVIPGGWGRDMAC
ncbi:hypothetical protein BKA70DRAFT_1314617 [Coprinopsis sp. MPI-PUGE-AT-0042]|nr:hypothetical protein BKA70DRAFT_1314617 [Coprinopsis sp. MPI-PUGE-AT-0042]